MKKFNSKKFLFIIAPITGLAIFFWFSNNKTTTNSNQKTLVQTKKTYQKNSQNLKPTKPIIKDKASGLGRTTASVPTKLQSRRVIGSKLPIEKLHLSNKVSSSWKEKYINNFQRMTKASNIIDFKVKNQQSAIYVKRNYAINVEHVIVSYKTPGGVPFSFEAYINSETGQMVQSWNQTRLEIRRSIGLSSKGKGFTPSI
jgi:hypothetical protein